MKVVSVVDTPKSKSPSGEGPTVIYGDPVSHRLLYLRHFWKLDVPSTKLADLGAPIERITTTNPDDYTWLQAWRHAWQCTEHAQEGARSGQAVLLPDAIPGEWFGAETPGFDDAKFLDWQWSVRSTSAGLSGRSNEILHVAEEASRHGLYAIYVLPIDGAWHARTKTLLAVANETFDSDRLLTGALRAF